ncbi:MAG: DUF58 domain-containing protein [Verrucomicrobia bacterium]|nr:DUF58 domain-containing protein [Verrucomicrobiota bacterium]MDA1006230.1 DUF58 domain-containing protein [Verrucomicrobiota bacterium]
MLSQQAIEEVMQRVRRLEIRAKRLVNESFAGEYHSSFKGQGLDFDEFREYQHGDEIRLIDWNVTARMGTPFIRKFREERELSVILAVDVSRSTVYGSQHRSKRELAAEIAAVLAFSARDNGDKVGLLLFAAEPILFLPPAKGSKQILRSVREILTAVPEKPGTDIASACDFLLTTLRRKALVFLLSDFLDTEIRKPLGTLSRKHETIALRLFDPAEEQIPDVGKVVLRDNEHGYERVVNTSNSNVRMAYQKLTRRHRQGVRAIFKRYGIDHASISTSSDYLPALHQLLKRHALRKNH